MTLRSRIAAMMEGREGPGNAGIRGQLALDQWCSDYFVPHNQVLTFDRESGQWLIEDFAGNRYDIDAFEDSMNKALNRASKISAAMLKKQMEDRAAMLKRSGDQ
jgi:hypothetical protein